MEFDVTRLTTLSIALLLAAVLTAAGCISGGTSGPKPCQPGTTSVCYCSGGGQGTAVCQQNGYLGQCTGCTGGGGGGDAGGQDAHQGLDASDGTGPGSDSGTQTDASSSSDGGSQSCQMIPVCLNGDVYERNSCTNQVSSSPVQTCESGCSEGMCNGTSCTPSCEFAECGPDGCGGTCGTCESTETCTEGVCEAESGGGAQGSCTNTSDVCVEATGNGYTTSQFQTECENNSGTYSSSPCPSGAVGKCVVGAGGPYESVAYFYGPTWTDSTARSRCDGNSGTYTSL